MQQLESVVDEWWALSLDGDRGLSASELSSRLAGTVSVSALFDDPREALHRALSSSNNQDIMLVTGSFVTVERLLLYLPDSGEL